MKCKIDGCENVYYAKGLCNTHYLHERRGPCSVDGCEKRARPENGLGYCTAHNNKLEKYGNPEYDDHWIYLDTQWRHKYQIGLDDYRTILYDVQGGACPLCQEYAPGMQEMKEGVFWCVDHDHGCCSGSRSCGNCVRGILCRGCNSALQAQVDESWLLRALDYIG